ncbi:alpha/beta fold hydrolase [Massilia cavernae]|uniref:alpha/beta fold hydrolase n=1 Tax=Massilia cavernae TaxID=2320864 RepID=UPI001C71DC28|nr:alpha/beta hydrolase [Massilia cavernae]
MTRDGIEVAEYVAKRFGQKSVILMGSSWGSVLAVHMAKARPGLFTAYVGTSQLLSYRDNSQGSYRGILAAARAAGDSKTVAALEALGTPPWTNPRNFGIARRASRIYEGKATTPAPKSWWTPAPGYDTPKAAADYEAGEDYSYIQFVGMQGDGIYSKVDLPALGMRFDLPVYIIQGEQDLVTIPAVTKPWFDALSAPRKEYVLLPQVGHDPNIAMVDAQYKIVKTLARPR